MVCKRSEAPAVTQTGSVKLLKEEWRKKCDRLPVTELSIYNWDLNIICFSIEKKRADWRIFLLPLTLSATAFPAQNCNWNIKIRWLRLNFVSCYKTSIVILKEHDCERGWRLIKDDIFQLHFVDRRGLQTDKLRLNWCSDDLQTVVLLPRIFHFLVNGKWRSDGLFLG